MAQWTNIDPNTLIPGSPLTSATAQAAFENVEAVAEGAPNAPITAAGWHPHNGTIIGAETGLIYDHAVDGNVTTIETPVLAAGFEYWLEWRGLTKTEGGNANATCGFRLSETGEYTFTNTIVPGALRDSVSRLLSGKIFLEPQVLRNAHQVEVRAWSSAVASGGAFPNGSMASVGSPRFAFTRTNATRIDRLRIVSSVADGIQGGQVYLFKRRFEGY